MEDTQTDVTGEQSGGETVHDDMQVLSNNESAKDMKENFATEEAPKDKTPEDAEAEKRTEAAKELGKAGGKAAAEKRAEKELEATETGEDEPEEVVAAPEETPAEAEEELKHRGQPKFDPKAKVQQATQRLAEERRRNEALEERLARLEAPKAAPEAPAQPTEALRPRKELYASDEDYIEALVDWKADHKIREIRTQDQEQAKQQAAVNSVVTRIDGFNERVAVAAQADPEMLDKVDPGLLGMTPSFLLPPDQVPTADSDIAQGIIESEHSAKLLVHLSDHPEELQKLRHLNDTNAVVRAIGRLEAKVSAAPKPAPAPAPKPAPVSAAAPPVKPIDGSPQYAEETADEDTPFDEYVRIANARDQRARRGK